MAAVELVMRQHPMGWFERIRWPSLGWARVATLSSRMAPYLLLVAIAGLSEGVGARPGLAQGNGTVAGCRSAESAVSDTAVYTADTVCQSGLTRPSLWWIREQLGSQLGKKLISNWVATPGTEAELGRVVVIVNPQAWSLLDYFARYEFVHAFGMAAIDFGYQTEVQDSRGVKLASYACGSAAGAGDRCQIEFDGSGSGFRGERRSPF